MAFWLAKHRTGQDSGYIQRFDPRFWTVNFPRPMMASVTTTGPDSLRVDCEFHHEGELAGLIWESEDTLDHPLLRYDTVRDYAHCVLRFRWRSGGLIPLDAPNGPTLTIEGEDASGTQRTWFVRLWNYASGSPTDATIELPFSSLAAGWSLPGEPVWPRAIGRMFISLVPPGYVAGSTARLAARANGWAEMHDISCDGRNAVIAIGDAVLPPHGTGICTAYDDSFNQTPARLLRTMEQLGYRGSFVHYVGMSHYYRVRPVGARMEVNSLCELAEPASVWHLDLFRRALAAGFQPIPSLSYELLEQNCPPAWMQRAHDGSPALTGWSPPSALLSPANTTVVNFLRNAFARLVRLLADAGAPQVLQIGEPWWWVMADGRICLYDDAARARFGGNPAVIADMRAPLTAAQKALLDTAGSVLAQSTSAIRHRVIMEAGPAAQVRLLVFTPTVLDPAMPELYRANLPRAWNWPLYDGLQLEDYDWLTGGHEADRRTAWDFAVQRLAYPQDRTEYLAGFVLLPEQADSHWRAIDAALDSAPMRDLPRRYGWALPQVARDGYTRLPPPSEEPMDAFDDVLYPLAPGRDVSASPEFSTTVAVTASGHERRNTLWSDARMSYDVGPGIRSEAELSVLLQFFRARRGAARGFRFADPFDCSSNAMTGVPGPADQLLGTGDGQSARFPLVKRYGTGSDAQVRRITRPRSGSVSVSVGGTQASGWTLDEGGVVVFSAAPPAGAEVRAGFLFDVPVRFAEDRLTVAGAAFAAGEVPSVPLIEVREAS
ncbi:MAG: TIGR02217 family protein [Sphingomonadaceae bacterium]|nr:TIGR02217 family protein [Sphingomonadaceae bacterium]